MEPFVSKSVQDTKKFAYNFATSLDGAHQGRGAQVVGLYGELGAGKTTFMKYLAEALGVGNTIQSPTFVIEKRYKIQKPESKSQNLVQTKIQDSRFQCLIHVDAYRLERGEDLVKLGWDEIIADPQNLICIEWPERVAEIMPPHIKIIFKHISENERGIIIKQ